MKKLYLPILFLLFFLPSFGQLSPNALLFNGVDNYIEVLPSSSFYQSIGTNPFTIEAWIRDDATATFSEEVILSTRDETGMTSQGFKFCVTNGNLAFFSQGGGTGHGFNLLDGLCHHVAISRDNTGATYIYIDGVAYSTNDPGNISSMLNPFIGKSNGLWPNYFNGIIKGLRVWSISRTQNEIINNKNTIINSSSNPGLVDYWRMDEGSGSMIANYGNSGNGSFFYASPTWTTGCAGCILPTASITASGPTNVCLGNNVTLNANTGTGLSYQWKKNGNNISGATSSAYSASSTGNYFVVVSNTCGTTTSNSIAVNVINAPSATITASGSTSICAGNSVLLNANTGSGLTYQWKINGNNISGANSSSYTANTAGNYSVFVSNSCGSSTSNVISVTTQSAPGATVNASGPTSFCMGGFVILNANTGTGLTYQWKLNGNNISGAFFSSHTVNTAGNYSVVVSNSCGSNTSNVISVTIQSAPIATITASGSTSICAGNSVLLSANTGTGLSYQWQINGSNINGATNSTFNATSSGNYSVIVSNNCGNSISNIIPIAVTATPGSSGTITGPSSVCRNSTQSFSVSSVASATSYIWTVPPQAQIISGAGTNSVVVKFKTKQGNVTVKAANQCGTGPLSVLPVQVINCSNSRNSIPNPNLKIVVYPNPSISDFNCIIPGEEKQLVEMRIFDQTGRIIEMHENITAKNKFTFGDNFVAGFYFVEIISGGEKEIFKLVKIK